jgi:hypothetical protein
MVVEVPVLGIVIIVFLFHTVMTHLINWMFRDSLNEVTGSLTGLSIVAGIVEFIICIGVLNFYIN